MATQESRPHTAPNWGANVPPSADNPSYRNCSVLLCARCANAVGNNTVNRETSEKGARNAIKRLAEFHHVLEKDTVEKPHKLRIFDNLAIFRQLQHLRIEYHKRKGSLCLVSWGNKHHGVCRYVYVCTWYVCMYVYKGVNYDSG